MTGSLKCPCCGEGGAKAPLLALLYRMEKDLGRSLSVNSGYRCWRHNAEVGGSTTSEHLLGLAADLDCKNSAERFFLLGAAIRCGALRIGIGSNFLHVGVSPDHPQRVAWTY